MNIKFHPDWKFNKGNYDADIAIVTLFGPVALTDTVQPICLPAQNDGVLIAPDGIVVSFQRDLSLDKLLILGFSLGWHKQHRQSKQQTESVSRKE